MLKRGEHDGCILAQNFLTVSRWSWVEPFSLKEESRGENVNMKNINQDDFGTSPLYDIKATLSVSVAKGTSFFRVVHHPVYWTLNLHPCLIWKLCLKFFSFSEWHRISKRNEKGFFFDLQQQGKKIMLSRSFIDVKFLKLLKTLPCFEHHYPGWNDV